MDTLSLYGNIASLAGCMLSVVSVIVSIVVAWNVRAIRRHYNFIGRGDDFLIRLQEHSTDLTSSLNEFAASDNIIGAHLAKLKATL